MFKVHLAGMWVVAVIAVGSLCYGARRHRDREGRK